MKKLLLILTSFLLAISLAACGSSPPPAPPQNQDDVDAVTSASQKESSHPADIINGLSEDGFWIFAILSDVTIGQELVVGGEFHQKDDPAQDVFRKFALYAQDADRNVTANYTLTVPQITVYSPNFRIQQGVVKGNIVVDALGFELMDTVLEGDLTFTTQAQKDSASFDENNITGAVSVM